MKTKKFILGIVTTLVCAIAMIGVLGPVAIKQEKGVNALAVQNSFPGYMKQFFERSGANDASNWFRK